MLMTIIFYGQYFIVYSRIDMRHRRRRYYQAGVGCNGIMSVSNISFLSGCTVLAMSIVSVYKNVRAKT